MMSAECETDTSDGEGFSVATLDEIASCFDPPSQALTEMVRRVANHLELDVCSVYVLERDRQHLRLAATMGLNQSSVGHVRMKISEGLAGLVVERRRSVSVAAAADHPRFKYFPEAGEERYSSFHGLAVIDEEHLQGVLVVQTVEPREFSAEEVEIFDFFADAISPYVARCRTVEYLND
jgi:signal transduction protein with GAF and PtsI domain